VETRQSDGVIKGWLALERQVGMCKHSIKTRMIYGDFPLPIARPRGKGVRVVWEKWRFSSGSRGIPLARLAA